MTVSESYLTVQYDLRLAKQIERRMLVDALLRLSDSHFQIRDYLYTGFGSIFFIDFILFKKYVGLRRMQSIEHSESIKKRIAFNRPYKDIELKYGPMSDFISELDPDLKHILWLDYDFHVTREMISDVIAAAAQLSTGSILLITVDVTQPCDGGPDDWASYFEDQAGDFVDPPSGPGAFGKPRLPKINAGILRNAIQNGLTGRSNLSFLPLFHFLYADGHKMITLGGIIGGSQERHNLGACDFSDAAYIRRSFDDLPYEIMPPVLTRKERLYLDSEMPCDDGWKPKDFELDGESVMRYRELYRYFPLYVESLL